MHSSEWSWDALRMASIMIAAGALMQSQPAAWAEDAAVPEGRIVDINSGETAELPTAEDATAVEPGQPVFWIGIRGRVVSDPVLRTQFQLAEDMGVVVEEVLEDSPAAKAGLRQHDILLRADGEGIQSMEDLAKLVSAGEGKPIELQLIRLAKEETIAVTPEARPAGLADNSDPLPGFSGLGGINDEAMRELLARMPEMGGMRMFGPGVVVNGQVLNQLAVPNGVAVTVERSGEGPAKITVKQGDQTWTIDSNDAEALKELPEDVRGYVSQLMEGNGPFGQFNFDLQRELGQNLPQHLGQFFQAPVPPPVPGVNPPQDPVLKKMEELERQLHELQQRLEQEEAAK